MSNNTQFTLSTYNGGPLRNVLYEYPYRRMVSQQRMHQYGTNLMVLPVQLWLLSHMFLRSNCVFQIEVHIFSNTFFHFARLIGLDVHLLFIIIHRHKAIIFRISHCTQPGIIYHSTCLNVCHNEKRYK